MQIAPVQAPRSMDLAQNARGAGAHDDKKAGSPATHHFSPEGFPYGNALKVIDALAKVALPPPAPTEPGSNLNVKL